MHVAITVTFIIMGFGIKLGVIPWHFVLPISYQAAPYSAAVALGGAMLNAGMLGWLRFLPLGHSASPDWGVALIVLGMLASFLGVVLGVFQKNPKALLGYSSVSQVGLMTVIVGVALVDPGQWKILSAVLLIYVFHHALAKGALFYAAGFRTALSKPVYYWMCFALLLPALSIAGAPLTSGALAKSGFKTVLPALPEPWSMWLVYLLPLSSVATSLLLMRFIFMVWPQRVRAPGSPDTALYGQVLLTLAVAIMAWLFASVNGGQTVAVALKAASLWASSWPLMAAIILAAVAVWLGKRFNLRLRVLPAGDLLLPIESILRYALKLLLRLALFIETMWSRTKLSLNASLLDESLQASERILRSPVTVGVMFILMFLGILLTLGILLNR
jgi:formate hydrogenlyase subunit 3/multisubunit Na+/H+ antiporter MnhD subunit